MRQMAFRAQTTLSTIFMRLKLALCSPASCLNFPLSTLNSAAVMFCLIPLFPRLREAAVALHTLAFIF